jgi:hypothetical protein
MALSRQRLLGRARPRLVWLVGVGVAAAMLVGCTTETQGHSAGAASSPSQASVSPVNTSGASTVSTVASAGSSLTSAAPGKVVTTAVTAKPAAPVTVTVSGSAAPTAPTGSIVVVSVGEAFGALSVTLTFTCTNGTGATVAVGATNPQTNVEYGPNEAVPATCGTPGQSERQGLVTDANQHDIWTAGDKVIIQGIFKFANGPTVITDQTLTVTVAN